MPRHDPNLKPFFLDALSQKKYPNLLWLDEPSGLFKLTFSRFGGRGPWEDDEALLRDYEHVIKRPYEGYSKARVNLTSAVKSSDSFKMIKEVKDGYIFQFRSSDLRGTSEELDSTLHPDLLLTEDFADNHYLWPKESVSLLIECYKMHQEEMENPGSKKKDVWFTISELMKEKGISVTADICSSKWRNLRRTYKVIQERNNLQPDRVQSNWEFFHLLQDVYNRDTATEEEDSTPVISSPSFVTFPVVSFVGLPVNPQSYAVTADFVPEEEDSDRKEKNAIETVKRHLQSAHTKHCSEVRKLGECIRESNKLNGEKNEILKNSLKERNLILKKYLREKNDTLRELLKMRRNPT